MNKNEQEKKVLFSYKKNDEALETYDNIIGCKIVLKFSKKNVSTEIIKEEIKSAVADSNK
ncbi:MAG: hypothetical protein RR504_07120 [Christensenellaceae bacterium]